MGDRTQSTLNQMLARSIIELINAPDKNNKTEKQEEAKKDEYGFDDFDEYAMAQEIELKYTELVLFSGIKFHKQKDVSDQKCEFLSKKDLGSKEDLIYLKYLSWIISRTFKDIFK